MDERDRNMLEVLISAYDQTAKYGWDGVAPIDCGGRNGSDHSYRLSKLAKMGLAEQRYRGPDWGVKPARSRYRGSKLYRPTDAGRLAIAQE